MPVEGGQPTDVILDPTQYSEVSTYELLCAAAQGRAGMDHRFLKAVLDRPEKSIPDLVRFGLEDRQNDLIDLEEDLIDILRHLRTPDAIPFYVECVRRCPQDVSDELVEAFAQFPQASTEALLQLYEDLGHEEGGEVAFVLASLRVRDPRVRSLLVERFERDPGEGAFDLGLYGDPSVKPELERILSTLNPKDSAARATRAAIETAVGDIDLTEPPLDIEPTDIWEEYPEQAGPAFEILSDEDRLEFLGSGCAQYRAEAAESFFGAEPDERIRRALLDTARRDPEPEVRARCWESLALASDQPEVRSLMLHRLEDTSAPLVERAGALVGLFLEAEDPAVRKWILEFYGEPATRAKALETMWRSMDRRFASYFPQHLDDPDRDVRRQAIYGVGHLTISAEVGRLRKLFQDEEFREDALFAYALAMPSEISRGRVRTLLRRVDKEAGGLSLVEADLVKRALDHRLERNGLDPVFAAERESGED